MLENFAYDVFTQSLVFKDTYKEVTEGDYFHLMLEMETKGIKISKAKLRESCYLSAYRNQVNSLIDFLDTLKWDGKPRINGWLNDYMGASSTCVDISSKWLIGVCARIYEPGCRFETILILKDSDPDALICLSNINENNYFLKTKNSNFVELMRRKIIVDCKINTRKRWFFTTNSDWYKRREAKRGFVMVSINNNEDLPVNWRYWEVKCGKADMAALERDKYQLWAEAIHRYKSGEEYWINWDVKLLQEAIKRGSLFA